MIRIIVLFLISFTLVGCVKLKDREIKSPCVSAPAIDGKQSPCDRRPVNWSVS